MFSWMATQRIEDDQGTAKFSRSLWAQKSHCQSSSHKDHVMVFTNCNRAILEGQGTPIHGMLTWLIASETGDLCWPLTQLALPNPQISVHFIGKKQRLIMPCTGFCSQSGVQLRA